MLGWGFGARGGVRFVERPSHGGSRLTTLDAHVFEGGPSVLRWVHGVCFSLWWRGFVGGSLYLYDVEGSTRRCWTGSLVSPCVLLSRRVLFFGAACCGFALRYDTWAAGSPLEERVYSPRRPVPSTGARRRRVLVWSGVALRCLCGGSRRQVSSREGEGATSSFFFGRSLAPPLLCKKGRLFTTNMMVTTTTTT